MNASYLKFLKFVVAVIYYGSIISLIGIGIVFTLGMVKPQNFQISIGTPLKAPTIGTFDEPGFTGRISGSEDLQLMFTSFSPDTIQEHPGVYVPVALAILLSFVFLYLLPGS